jgi:hypothetical protein
MDIGDNTVTDNIRFRVQQKNHTEIELSKCI